MKLKHFSNVCEVCLTAKVLNEKGSFNRCSYWIENSFRQGHRDERRKDRKCLRDKYSKHVSSSEKVGIKQKIVRTTEGTGDWKASWDEEVWWFDPVCEWIESGASRDAVRPLFTVLLSTWKAHLFHQLLRQACGHPTQLQHYSFSQQS